eukprot:CAMPEP_0119006416 /NCGR_PEP_ID=MMETSP1176-20130426/2281_1 /TAXON_ID=265551 /ORGANISM="Synedropsis recta cf, Strain CCMP1620" /LENGTH=226 /DNA_ID=CAMNT_0006958325 /DNA_START=27 /DNA_END=707 /DNA_ORIENTATION=-
MRVSLFLALVGSAAAFTAPAATFNSRPSVLVVRSAVEETPAAEAAEPEAEAPPAASSNEEPEIPTNLPSEKGMDYVPLATMLATGQLEEADQFTRDALIVLAGSKEAGRNFVYFTEVKNIPNTDLATIERLWNKFSKGKFGYSVQKKKYRQSKQDFELFCQKIGWNVMDGDVERKKRWFGNSEFTYSVKKAPEGHLPLTSALRGTSLLKSILAHPVWDDDEWMKEP